MLLKYNKGTTSKSTKRKKCMDTVNEGEVLVEQKLLLWRPVPNNQRER